MMQKKLRTLFEEVAAGRLDIDAAVRNLRTPEMVDLGFARVDIDRSRRRGIPEVVFGEGKTPAQIAALLCTLDAEGQRALATRVKPDVARIVLEELPDMPVVYAEDARCLYVERAPAEIVGVGTVLVVSAGTADGPVAAEAALTARLCGNRVETVSDVGVAGLHRLLAEQERLRAANVLIV
jgi:NCAIR mutase (PurE)-related protein